MIERDFAGETAARKSFHAFSRQYIEFRDGPVNGIAVHEGHYD